MSYELLIGNKNYSSWSLRPWMILKAFNIPFVEHRIPFETSEFAEKVTSGLLSPNRRVPVLIDGATRVWDSLAIAEYLAERHEGLWPSHPVARAHARSACAEMHSSFGALRSRMPMNVRRRYPVAPETAEQADIDRVCDLWGDARQRHSSLAGNAPFLYGAFSIADAYFAPVVFRFNTYAVALPSDLAQYRDLMLAHPSMRLWASEAEAETEVVDHEEPEYIYGKGTPPTLGEGLGERAAPTHA